MPNLLLAFPSFAPHTAWGLGERDLQTFAQSTRIQVITPGSTAGTALHVLSSLENPTSNWQQDSEAARASLSAAVSLLLRLLGRDAGPASSRDHVLLSVLAERRLRASLPCDFASLLEDVTRPPLDRIGALPVDKFLPKRERAALTAALNTLLASPTFATWREGIPLDIRSWLTPNSDRTPAIIVSVAHLDDDERALVLGVLLEEILSMGLRARLSAGPPAPTTS